MFKREHFFVYILDETNIAGTFIVQNLGKYDEGI